MTTRLGVWIDSERAVLVWIEGKQHEVQEIASGIEGRVHPTDGSRSGGTPYGPQDVGSDKKLERRRGHERDRFLTGVIDAIGARPDRVLVVGPGETRKHLKTAIEGAAGFKPTLLGVEAADRMSEGQLVKHLRARFDELG